MLKRMGVEEISGAKIKVWDNDKTFDRYTIQFRFKDGKKKEWVYYGSSTIPFNPMGFFQFVGEYPEMRPNSFFGKRVRFKDLPIDVQLVVTVVIMRGNNTFSIEEEKQ